MAQDCKHYQIAIVGTGFSGLGMAIALKKHGYHDFVVLERADDVGGTWRDNTYPGCACDIPSNLYSFSFALNPDWTRKYPRQQEILHYLRRCAKDFALLPHIRWNSPLHSAIWQEEGQCWRITAGQETFTATVLICGQGPLTEPALPRVPGLDTFTGTLFHSAQWNHTYDLTNKRVAVIGTGASAIQFIPQIQPLVKHLSVFQRTPPWIMPRNDYAVPPWQQTLFRLLPITQRIMRARIYALNEITALGLVYKAEILQAGVRVAQEHLQSQIADPELRAQLTPHYAMGCKRILVSDDFYPALAKPNVTLITNPIREVRAQSILTEDQQEHSIDAIICGTGFHVSDSPFPQHIQGRDGQTLAAYWQSEPQAYLGTTITTFPNLFLLIGPNTGLGHNSMVYMIESQIRYILHCLQLMKRRSLQTVEIQAVAQQRFNDEMQQRMQGTAWMTGCTSWYLNASGKNTTIWPGFTFEFRRRTRRFDLHNYTTQRKVNVQVATTRA